MMLVLGEVLTSLLPTSAAVPADAAQRMLGLTAGAPVIRSDRPISYVVSPERLEGVDCQVPAALDRGVRGIGTVATRAVLTGGHAFQASARTVAERSRYSRRVLWSHYLARPGTLQIIGRYQEEAMAAAFLAGAPKPSGLDLTPIAERTAIRARSGVQLARKVAVPSDRITLRWAALLGAGEEELHFRVDSPLHRTVRIATSACDLADVVTLCESLALHDWLLTTLEAILSRAPLTGPSEGAVVDRIQPAVDHLLHLWTPGFRLSRGARDLWDRLDRLAGFDHQWHTSVNRIRDHMAVSTLRERDRPGVPR
ncbi:SCO2521 family protein [Actinoplanes sichuanensis]|nr:SCO2521 family protein [Actinoplanes sichuanensis]